MTYGVFQYDGQLLSLIEVKNGLPVEEDYPIFGKSIVFIEFTNEYSMAYWLSRYDNKNFKIN